MTIQEMHIGLDLDLQQLNSNLFGKLPKESKDLLLNNTILEFVRSAVNSKVANNEIFNYSDIVQYYDAISTLIETSNAGTTLMYDGRRAVLPTKYYSLISSTSLIDTATILTNGELIKGKIYKVSKVGSTLTDFTSFGGGEDQALDTIFYCNAGGTPSWQIGTELTVLKESPNRLVKPQDIDSIDNNSYGNDEYSPLSYIMDNHLYVKSKDYDVSHISIRYARIPATVNIDTPVDCDLPIGTHETIVKITAQKIIKNDAMRNASANGQLPDTSRGQ